ncbi:MAG: mannose-1-phosphate guanyltransferase [Chloroflexi bacterium]|nr:MAG: mannose-1-phosphate guanyltransferase [Chloroflexota bacterium]
MDNLYAVILAGGSGTRLWPRSRTNRPKQFLDLMADETMIQQTVRRLLPIIPLERICFMVGDQHATEIQRELPSVPSDNIFMEPEARGTGPSVGLAAAYLQQRNPDAVMCSLHADHFIADEEGFRNALRSSYEVAQRGLLVTMGATPTFPEIGYGYIECGEALAPAGGHHVYRINRFVEKPALPAAEQMLASGGYLWNTGMFTWRLDTIMTAFAHWMPEFHGQLETITRNLDDRDLLALLWSQVASQTIDRGIMERADNGAVVPIDIGWSDIGSWATLHDLLVADEFGNVVKGDHLAIDTHKSFIHANGKLIATIGVRDIIVVETEDAILICAKDRAQEVKDIVEKLRESKRTDLL